MPDAYGAHAADRERRELAAVGVIGPSWVAAIHGAFARLAGLVTRRAIVAVIEAVDVRRLAGLECRRQVGDERFGPRSSGWVWTPS